MHIDWGFYMKIKMNKTRNQREYKRQEGRMLSPKRKVDYQLKLSL